jgi:thioesterase domain-containing protein
MYLPDGNIRFLGRRDEQLKVRGFRIEPGEIEATLKEHPAVTDAAVVADEDQRLVAYVIGTTVTGEELGVFVRQRLPDYMVPSFFVSLTELPLTANGKVDRIALRARIRTRLERVDERIGPRDLLESELARIWEELLHVEPDIRDNFFDLGGHSLLVVSLLSRVERATGKRLHVVDIFQAPTIESLATLLRDEVDRSAPGPLVAIQPHGSLTPVFFVHPAGGSVGSYFSLARALGQERPFYALEGTLAGNARQVELVAKNYVEAIRAVQSDGPYLFGGWSSGGVIAFEMARQLQVCRAEVALVVLLDSMPPGTVGAGDRLSLLAGFAGNLSIPVDSVSDELLRSETETQLNWLLEQAHRSQALPRDLGLDDLRRQFDLYLADIEAVRNYRPLAASFPLLLLHAANEDELAEQVARWAQLSSNKLEVHNVPGDHITMMRVPHVTTLAEFLRKRLARVETGR